MQADDGLNSLERDVNGMAELSLSHPLAARRVEEEIASNVFSQAGHFSTGQIPPLLQEAGSGVQQLAQVAGDGVRSAPRNDSRCPHRIHHQSAGVDEAGAELGGGLFFTGNAIGNNQGEGFT